MRKTCISREAAGREGVKFNPEVSRYFESPATTFGLVKATRLTANLGYDYLLRLGALPDVTSIHKQ